MKATSILLTAATAVALVAAGSYPVVTSDWFEQTFSGLAEGSPFTGQGATGGAWQAIPSGVAVVGTVNGVKGACVDLSQTTNTLRFVASASPAQSVRRIDFAVASEPTPWLPARLAGDVAALSFASGEDGVLTFAGDTAGGWVKLSCPGFVQHRAEWLDCRAVFDTSANTVTYYARCGGTDYQVLASEAGETSFAVDAGAVTTLLFGGTGAIGAFAGKGVAQDATRVYTWAGPASGNWCVAANWKDYLGATASTFPGKDDLASVAAGSTITFGKYTFDFKTASQLTLASNAFVRIDAGNVGITCADGDYTSLGRVIAGPGATVRASGRYAAIELAAGSTLSLDASKGLTITSRPISLEGVTLLVSTMPSGAATKEAVVAIVAPYGSGGVPTCSLAGWTTAWHGCLDGIAKLWLVNGAYTENVAVWKDGRWGNLIYSDNWDAIKPSALVAARMSNGQAHMGADETFDFTRRFEIGRAGAGEVDMSDGLVRGNDGAGALVVGAAGGTGLLDVVGGTVLPCDYLWHYALTLGADTNATGTVMVRGGRVAAATGSVSVGAESAAHLAIASGSVAVGDEVGVGNAGTLDVSGGVLAVSNSLYIGRSTRGAAYDVTMTVSAGAVSNLAAGAICVGSYGGVGSKAVVSVTGGEMYATNQFVCGGVRSADVTLTGGALAAPEICVGQDLIDEEDVAAFTLIDGCVTTAGFTSGTNGERRVTLAGGTLCATQANDDFFKGLACVTLSGEAVLDAACDITNKAAFMGCGGLVKTGAGTLTTTGYAAWAGATVVEDGVLDMDGGMIMGSLAVADGAAVRNAKYDDLDALSFAETDWHNGAASTSPYLRIAFTLAADATGAAVAVDGVGETKGGMRRTADGVQGYTPLGWVDLVRADGAAVGAAACDVRMFFDFNGGKPYVVYEILEDGRYARLMTLDGLTVLPVAGDRLCVTTFSGATMTSGKELTVVSGSALYWIGPEGGAWNDGANWSTTAGGGAAGVSPMADTTAYVTTDASIQLAAGCQAHALVVHAAATLSGSSLTLGAGITGHGRLTLSGAAITAGALIDAPVEIVGAGNSVYGDATLAGALSGSGELELGVLLTGDAQAFCGRCTPMAGGIGSVVAAYQPRAAWALSSGCFPFVLSDVGYTFGALNGTFSGEAGDATNLTLIVGARDEDCVLGGAWFAGSNAGFEWAAETATMTYAVAETAFIRLSGGGTVLIEEAEALPDAFTFVDRGGTVKLDAACAVDISGLFSNSTAAVAFDDDGVDRVWEQAVGASNAGGFVKRGAGTLTWTQVPAYTGETVVEDGVLVVPYGTQLSSLRLGYNAQLVVDMGGSTAAGIAFSVARVNRALDAAHFQVVNAGAPYRTEQVGDENGIVLYVGSETFVWTGAVDQSWEKVKNWVIGDAVATRLPGEQDVVCFTNAVTVKLSDDVFVRRVEGAAALTLSGSGGVLHAAGDVFIAGRLAFVGEAGIDATRASVATLCGTGVVRVATGSLMVAPVENTEDVFVGTLSVTNVVKAGAGIFRFEPRAAFTGTLALCAGTMQWACANALTNQSQAAVTMAAGATLDLCGADVLVQDFTGAGVVTNSTLTTTSGVITQQGGDLTIPATARTTYVLSHAGERLMILNADGLGVTIVVPKSWYVAGVSGRRAVLAAGGWNNVAWQPDAECAHIFKVVNEGDDWWSIAGGGFAVRLK